MCYYELPACVYPHHDAVRNLIFDPQENKRWVECDLPKPWGRMSCGKLIIYHPVLLEHLPAAYAPLVSPPLHVNGDETAKADQHSTSDTELTHPETTLANSTERKKGILQCTWCTAALKYVATKAKYLQKDAKLELETLSALVDQSPTAKDLHQQIARKEEELATLRYQAWMLFVAHMVEHSDKNSPGSKHH